MKFVRVALSVVWSAGIVIAAATAQQQPPFRPWMSPGKEAPTLSRSKTPSVDRLFTLSTHADTAAFTPSPTDLPNVFEGDAVFIDYDNDGDLDVLISGWDGAETIARIYRNDNGTFTDINAGLVGVISYRGVAWGDYDNDGDYDLAMTGSTDTLGQNLISKIYRNDNGTFVDINAPLQPLIGGVATWVDYDLDGKLDLMIAGSPDLGSTFATHLYRQGDTTFTDIGPVFPGVWGASVDWGDYDNDGDPDLLLFGYGSLGVTGALFRNDTAAFTEVGIPYTPLTYVAVSWGDFDNDGDLDYVVTGDPPGWDDNVYTALYENKGNGTFQFVPTNLPQLNAASVAWGDYDNDGDLDLAVCGWLNDSANVTKIFRNDGGGAFTDINADLIGVWWGSVTWGDVDNDGKLDLLVTGGAGPQLYMSRYMGEPHGPILPTTMIYHNNTAKANQKPTAPATVSANIAGNEVTFSWTGSTDDDTPPPMLSYNLRIGSSPGGEDVLAPASHLATGFRRVPKGGNNVHQLTRTMNLPQGTYYWSVQAVDNGYAGSPFSAEGVVSFSPPGTARWQLLSLPYTYADWSKELLFPTAVSNAFAYQPGGGYTVATVMQNGVGYWVKFPNSTLPIPFSTGTISELSVPVSAGWNLIGSLSQQINASDITSDPPGITASEFFRYDGSYLTSATINPGNGYWVKTAQAGTLQLSSALAAGSSSRRIRIVPANELPPPPPSEDQAGPAPLPSAYALEQNYPNPFNPSTLISYRLPARSIVSVRIYTLLGQEVQTLVSGVEEAGYKSVRWDARNVPSGLYFCRLSAVSQDKTGISFTDVKKMVVAK